MVDWIDVIEAATRVIPWAVIILALIFIVPEEWENYRRRRRARARN